MITEEHERVAALLYAIWRGIPNDYKSRYRRNIWQQFEDRIRSKAYTSNLGEFINSLCLSFGVKVSNEGRVLMMDVLEKLTDDHAVLKMLREETLLLVMLVQETNEQRQDELVDTQTRLAHHAAQRLILAQSARAIGGKVHRYSSMFR